jgi:NAD(P)-dependent dehydrogenase (short-subunit alcohol dehydrogenase family)
MQERNILITGGTDGQGKAAAHQLAEMGACLLLVSRNRQKGEAAATEISAASGCETVTFFQADLSLVREMQRVAEHAQQSFDRLDVLLHAAGGGFPNQRRNQPMTRWL